MTKAERTKQFIIEQTAPIFNKKGYLGTSMADITEATGLTKGAVYGNFTDKEEVAAAVLEYNINRLNRHIQKNVDLETSAKAKLYAYLKAYKEVAPSIFSYGGCSYMNTAIEVDDTNPALYEIITSKFKNWIDVLEATIALGKKQGDIKPDTNGTDFAYFFISLVEGSILLAKTMGKTEIIYINLNALKQKIEDILIT